jgi:hypothetical protein
LRQVRSIFAEAAFLAGRAIEAAIELQRMPGMSAEAFAETLDFGRRFRDHAGTAALDAIGAAHNRHSRLVRCFQSGHGLVHMRNEVLVVENDVEK